MPEEIVCKGCGVCCKYIRIASRNMLKDEKELYLIRNAIDLGDGYLRLPSRCKYLQEDDYCAIYETRPAVCRNFPIGGSECLLARRLLMGSLTKFLPDQPE